MRHFLHPLITIELDHLLNDLVLGAVQVRVIVKLPRVVPTLLGNPLLLAGLEVALELAVVLADDALGRVVEAVSNVVRAFRDVLEAIDVVANERFAIGSQALHLLGVESPVLNRAVIPLLVLELKVIVEEVFAVDELSAVPLRHVFTLE